MAQGGGGTQALHGEEMAGPRDNVTGKVMEAWSRSSGMGNLRVTFNQGTFSSLWHR